MSETPESAPAPFSIPLFRRIWVANVTSQFGSLIQGVGAAWLMVELGGSKTQIALVNASVTFPILILALFAGALADNYSRRSVMLWAQIGMFSVSVLLCVLAWLGLLTPWILLGFTFLIGCGTAINAPSWQATVGDIVPRKTIAAAVSMNSMGFNIARSAGPALGGAIVAAAGAAAAFTINAFTYLGILFVLIRWKPDDATKPRLREGLIASMAAGVRYVSMSPPVRLVVVRGVLFGIAASSVLSLLPLVAHDILGGDAAMFGILSGSFGIGAVIGALSNRHLRDRFHNENILRISVICVIAGAVTVSQSHNLLMAVPGLIVTGAGWLTAVATMNVTVQMSVPRWVVGRSLALFQMAIFGSMTFGSWLSGQLADEYGTANAMLIMMAIQGIGLLAGFFMPIPDVEEINLDPVGRWKEPDVNLDITQRSGPVAIGVYYRIREADLPKFLNLMNERHRVRVRDGAQDWTLARDLHEPEIWVERYRFPRWRDYILHNERQTHADRGSLLALKDLHQGEWPLKIERMLERPVSNEIIETDQRSDMTIDPGRPTIPR